MKNKKRFLSTAIAGTLAAAILVGGGTFAYLKDKTEKVENKFKAQSVTVELTETTGGTYRILPGQTVSKDPKVTPKVEVDSYLFVKVDDNAKKTVTYDIAEGWEKLTLNDSEDVVYYRVVTAEDNIPEGGFSVLKNDQVTFNSKLENKEGDDTTLAFTAYVIQKAGFTSPAEAYAEATTENTHQ